MELCKVEKVKKVYKVNKVVTIKKKERSRNTLKGFKLIKRNIIFTLIMLISFISFPPSEAEPESYDQLKNNIFPASVQNDDVAFDITCTQIVVHDCSFYNLAITDPIITKLEQENLGEYLNQTLNESLYEDKSQGICFAKKQELEYLRDYVMNKLQGKFDICINSKYSYLNCAKEKRYFIKFILNPQKFSGVSSFSNISSMSFEYDGIHMEAIMTIINKQKLESLLKSPYPLAFLTNPEDSLNLENPKNFLDANENQTVQGFYGGGEPPVKTGGLNPPPPNSIRMP